MKTTNRILTFATGAGLALMASTSAFADLAYDRDRHEGRYSDRGYTHSTEFRHDNPINVYVDIETRGRQRDEDRFERLTERAMVQSLPGYVHLVNNRRRADMVITARETDYDLDFRVVDRSRQQKPYKKINMRTADRCGPLYKTSYRVVQEKVEARASYSIHIRTDGVGKDRERIRTGAENYLTYGEDLKAHTRCSAEPTNRFPDMQVKELFENNSKASRRYIAKAVRQETATDLGRKLSSEIRDNVDDYYAQLAVRHAHGAHGFPHDRRH